MKIEAKKSSDSMITVKDSDPIAMKSGCNWCAEPSCCHNEFFVPEQACPTRSGIPINSCPIIYGFIKNNTLYITLRYWVKEFFIKKVSPSFPFKFTKTVQSKGVKYSMPARIFNGIIKVIKGTISKINNKRRKKKLKNLFWQLKEH